MGLTLPERPLRHGGRSPLGLVPTLQAARASSDSRVRQTGGLSSSGTCGSIFGMARLGLSRAPSSDLSATPRAAGAVDVLAAVPEWWARRARLAGLPAEWRDWKRALGPPP